MKKPQLRRLDRQPSESVKRYAQIDPLLQSEFKWAYEQLIGPTLAGATDPFQAEQAALDELMERSRQGFVPLKGYPGGGVHITPPIDGAAVPPAEKSYRTVWRSAQRIRPEHRPFVAIAAIVLFAVIGVLVTMPRGETAQNRVPSGRSAALRARTAAAPVPTPTTNPREALAAAGALTATTTVSGTDPAYPAGDASMLSSVQNALPATARESLLTPVSVEVNGAGGKHVYRVITSAPATDGTWRPQLAEGVIAWLQGTVVNQVFCLPAATLPPVKAGDTLLIRTKSSAPLRYTIQSARTDIEWQQTELLGQRRNGVTVLGCGGPPTAPRSVWLASFRIEDQPDTPAAQPTPAPKPTAPPPLDIAAIAAHVMTDPAKPANGNVLMLSLSVVNRSDKPVDLDPSALQVVDGTSGGQLALEGGLPITVKPGKDRQTVMLSVAAPQKGMAILETDQRFGQRKWHLTPKSQ